MSTDLTEFQQRAASVALVNMFKDKHFSICDLDSIADTMGRKQFCAGRDYSALRALHCSNWADMGPDLTRMVQEKCLEILGLPPQVVDVVSEVKAEPAHKPATRLRLAFWRQQ